MPWELLLFYKLVLLIFVLNFLLFSRQSDSFKGVGGLHAEIDSESLLPTLAIGNV